MEYKKLESQLVATTAKATILEQKLKEINALKMQTAVNQLNALGNSFTALGNAIAPVSAIAAALIAALAGIEYATLKDIDTISTLSKELNLTASSLEKWQYIAMMTDVSDSDLQNGLAKIQVALADLSSGTVSDATTALHH